MNKCSKFDKYSPFSHQFKVDHWEAHHLNDSRHCQKCFNKYRGGLVLGKIISLIDEQYDQLINAYEPIEADELISFAVKQILCTMNHVWEVGNNKPSSLADGSLDWTDSYLEVFISAVEVLVKHSSNKSTLKKLLTKDQKLHFIETITQLLMRRNFYVEKWLLIRDFNWKINETPHGIYIQANGQQKDFGKAISISKYENDLKQLSYLAKENLGHKSATLLRNIAIENQIPFYYYYFKNIGFNNNPNITLEMIIEFWFYLSELSENIRKKILKEDINEIDINNYISFPKNNLINKVSKKLVCNVSVAHNLIKLFTFTKKNVKDIWLKPIYESGDNYNLIAPAILACQFQRVVNTIVNENLKDAQNLTGKSFEKGILFTLSKAIQENKILNNGFCKVLLGNYEPSNQEIDVVIRIGETYLLIEAKSSLFQTSADGYNRILKKMMKSDVHAKKKAFIDDYEIFRKRYDRNTDFVLNEKNVISCYLTSVPHAVGTTINNTPVVDLSILERYFNDGYFKFLDNEKLEKFFFYKTFQQAESNLYKYLLDPPQLLRYRENFEIYKHTIPASEFGFPIVVDSPYINLTEKNEVASAQNTKLLNENWYHEK